MEGDKQNIFSVNGGSVGHNSARTPAVLRDMIKVLPVLRNFEEL